MRQHGLELTKAKAKAKQPAERAYGGGGEKRKRTSGAADVAQRDWRCNTCTGRDMVMAAGARCGVCEAWQCPKCTSQNNTFATECGACGQ